MRQFDHIKIKGLTINYGKDSNPLSVTLKIPLGDDNYAKETITPEEVTKRFILDCKKKRSDFINDWNQWRVERLGAFDYKKHFWGSKNRKKYMLDGGDQKTLVELLDERYRKLKSDGVVTKKTLKSNYGEINILKKYFNTHHEEIHVSELTRKHIQEMVTSAGVTPKTIRLRTYHLEQLIQDAMTDGIIHLNLFHGWKPKHEPKNRSTYVREAYNEEEFNLILTEAQNDKDFYPLFLFRCTMGMRPGEVYGLKWKYVDELHNQIEVKETLEEDWTFKNSPKTEAGHRKIKLNSYSLAAIQAQRLLTDSSNPDALVFQLERAKNKLNAWSGSTFKNRYDTIMSKVTKNHSIKKIWSYGLRHSFASILWNSEQIAIKDLSVLLGHSSVKVTEDFYLVKNKPVEGTTTSAIDTLLDPKLAIIPSSK